MECLYCHKKFKQKKNYENHIKTHNNYKNNIINQLNIIDSNNYKYIYVHIPKCAGTFINNFFKKSTSHLICSRCVVQNDDIINKNIINFGHNGFKDVPKNYNINKKIISFVRNPYSRIVSMYHYHKIYKYNISFKDFIKYIYNDAKIFKYLTSCDDLNDTYDFNLLKTPRNNTNISISWKNQSSWLPRDSFFIGKIENIKDDLEELCKKLNIDFDDTKIRILNKSNHDNYKNYYDEETINIVKEIYKEDLTRFNYIF